MKFCGKSSKVLLCLMQAIAIAPSYAIEPQNFDLGDFKFTPQVNAKLSYQDNFLHNDDNKKDSWIATVAPQFEISQMRGLNAYRINYQISNNTYLQSSEDNYTAHKLSAIAALDLQTRHRVNFDVSYNRDYEERGKEYSIGFANLLKEPTGYEMYNLKGLYSYGATTAQANVDFVYRFSKINWDSLYRDDLSVQLPGDNIDVTANREYESNQIGSTFNYKTGAFTKVTFSINIGEVDYQNARANEAELDSDNANAFVGFEWQGSAITTGYARVGYSEKSFDSNEWDDTSGFRWQVGILWTPLTYSNFDFSTAREVSETKGQGSYIENTNYNLAWHHQWLDRVASKLTIQFSDDIYGDSPREDDNTSYSASLYYKMHRNIDLSASYIHSKRESNFNVLEYQGNTIEVGITASF